MEVPVAQWAEHWPSVPVPGQLLRSLCHSPLTLPEATPRNQHESKPSVSSAATDNWAWIRPVSVRGWLVISGTGCPGPLLHGVFHGSEGLVGQWLEVQILPGIFFCSLIIFLSFFQFLSLSLFPLHSLCPLAVLFFSVFLCFNLHTPASIPPPTHIH